MRRKRNSIRHNEYFRKDPVEDSSVDLHGLNCDEAEELTKRTLSNAESGEKILVIHGKGTGKLRDHIRKFLLTHPKVLKIDMGETVRLPGKGGVCLITVR